MLKEILTIIKEYKDAMRYRKQLLKDNINVDAFEYFLKQSRVKGVEIELIFANNTRAIIRPERVDQLPYKSFKDRFEESRKER